MTKRWIRSSPMAIRRAEAAAGTLPVGHIRTGAQRTNVRARIALLYKGAPQIDILGVPGRGTLVVLHIPLDGVEAS